MKAAWYPRTPRLKAASPGSLLVALKLVGIAVACTVKLAVSGFQRI